MSEYLRGSLILKVFANTLINFLVSNLILMGGLVEGEKEVAADACEQGEEGEEVKSDRD